MSRIAAQAPSDFQFRSSDNVPTRAQKLEILRQALARYSLIGHAHQISDVDGLQELLDSLLGITRGYNIPGYLTDTPTTNKTIHLHSVTADMYFRADFEGSEADIGINPTADFIVTIYRNPTFTGLIITGGEIIGTLTYSTAGVVTWQTTNNEEIQIDKGDVIGLKAPTADATAALASFTLYAIMAYIANLLLYTGDQNPDDITTVGLSGDEGDGSILLSGDMKYG